MESSRLFEQISAMVGKLPHLKLSKLMALLLSVYCAHLLANFTWQLVPTGSNNYGQISIVSSNNMASMTTNQSVNLDELLSLNLFGDLKQKAQAKPKPKSTLPAPKTRLNVKLTGLVADSSNATSPTSVAIIESAGGQNTYGVNEKIKGTPASVYEILIDRVILSVSGRYETLMLDGIEYSTSVPGDDNKVVREQPTVTAENTSNKPLKKERLDQRDNVELSESLREQRQNLFEDPQKLLDVIKVRPYKKRGELLGYKLSPGKDSKLFTEIGLKRNDLATSINGYDLTDMQQSLSVMKELQSMTEATITVVRNDTTIDIILAL